MGASPVPTAIALGFLRDEIAKNRGAAPASLRGALTFGVTGADGLTTWWSLYVDREGVRLVEGAVPIQYEGRLATCFTTEDALAEIMAGRSTEAMEVEGDTALLDELAHCMEGPMSLFGVRAKH